MDIGIIGAGFIGSTLARHFVRLSHQVRIANSRGPETLATLVEELGPSASATTVEGAAEAADLVVEAIPFGRYASLPASALSGKIVISAANYYPGRDGDIDLGGVTQTELVARHLSGSRVVKAFNTIYWEHLRDQSRPEAPLGQRRVIPLSGDDAEARAAVAALIESMGFAPLDMGGLAEGGSRTQPGDPIYNADLTLEQARELVGR